MSYCRFSTDDFQCDLYCYASVGGGFVTHVAGNRIAFVEELPPDVPFDTEHTEQWLERHNKVMDIISRSPREPIGLPHDGDTFSDETLQELLARLVMLRGMGYRLPEYVIDNVREEIANPEPEDPDAE